MAEKKADILKEEMKGLDLVSIINGGDGKPVFRKNNLADYSYRTGIPLIDYANGYEVLIRNDNGEVVDRRLCLGIQAGTLNTITGPTQSYKSTIGIIMCGNIAQGNEGNILHLDAEGRLIAQRVQTLTKLPYNWFTGDPPRYAIQKGSIGFDGIEEQITNIWMNKLKYKDLLMQDTGVKDGSNKPLFMLPPTVVFLDSLSSVLSKEYDIDNKKMMDGVGELHSNTYGMINAKTIRGMFQDIIPMMEEANIIMIQIAHQNSNPATSPMGGPKKQFQYGSVDVKVAGGKSVEYNSSLVATFTGESSADSRYFMDTDGFEGNTVLFEPTKSSTNVSGNVKTGRGYRLVIDKTHGSVDNLRSLVLFLNERGRLKGNKAGYKVLDKNGETISERFTWRKIYEDFNNDPSTYKSFMLVAKEELETLIAPAPDVSGQNVVFDVDSVINSL